MTHTVGMIEKGQGVGLAPLQAAQYLAAELGESWELWQYRLSNWRRPGRRSPLPASKATDGGLIYAEDALRAFVNMELARKILLESSPSPGEVRCGATPQIGGAELPHVRVVFAITPVCQSAFALGPAAARRLAASLNKAASLVEQRQSSEAS